jgi:hypothetical protein
LGQNSSGHVTLPIPAYEINFADTRDQPTEDRRGRCVRELHAWAAALSNSNQDQQKGSPHARGSPPVHSQEMAERGFVVSLTASATKPGIARDRVARVKQDLSLLSGEEMTS